MNEKELKKLKTGVIKRHIFGVCEPDTINMHIQADIARQLTRIADQGDDTAKARDHSVEPMMSALAVPEPDIALVEAVELAVRGHRSDRETWCVIHKCQAGIDNMVGTELGIHIIAVALAAHKKAVNDGS